MNNPKLLTLSCLVAALLAPTASRSEDFLLYVPKPAAADQLPASPDQGVLVKKVTVKPGDTLSQLSRKHIGVASWFPQVLVFNSVKNPDLIYPGDQLLIPVPTGHEASVKKASKRAKGSKHAKGKKRRSSRRSPHLAKPAVEQPKPALQPATSDEQQSYQRAKRAYLAGEYLKAQDLFTAFLQKFPSSSLAPDASLYQADCFMHLSGQ
jgi:LysM repeat protein